jgi:hypothetical protein
MELPDQQATQNDRVGLIRLLVASIRAILGLEEKKLTCIDINAIAKDAVRETGSADALRAYSSAREPSERDAIKAAWERRVAEKKSEQAPPFRS